MRAGTYYAIAAVLVLVTLPMYRYIFQRSRELDLPQPSPVVRVVQVDQRRVEPLPPLVMLPGELCIGGVVVYVNGNAYTNAVDGSGHALRCEGSRVLR